MSIVTSTPPPLSIRLLGDVAITYHGARVESRLPKKGVALLAFLASAPGTPKSRHQIAGLFWPDLPEPSARNNLRQTLTSIKRIFATGIPGLIANHSTIHYESNDACWCDLTRFLSPVPDCSPTKDPDHCGHCIHHLQEMTDLYRGRLLENLALEHCDAFDEWLRIQQEQLHQRALFLIERLTRCLEEQGQYTKAFTHAQRFLELDPWNDEGMRRVIHLAALTGQRGLALNQFQAFRKTLKSELGVAPEAKTLQLAQEIQREDVPPLPQPLPSVTAPDKTARNIEKRQLTACYCQFIPTIALDPEDELELLTKRLKRAEQILSVAGGYVIHNSTGSGLIACFGYPLAQERAATLAVRSALRITEEACVDTRSRIGVCTDLVLCARDRSQPDLAGRLFDRALGLSTLAKDGDVVVNEITQTLIRDNFACRDLGARLVPGSQRAESCFSVCDTAAALPLCQPLAPLTGRNREIDHLISLWHCVTAGAGRALLLQGEPGVGKSRLIQALKDRLDSDSLVLELRGTVEFAHSPFKPIIDLIESRFNLPLTHAGEKQQRLSRILKRRDPATALMIMPLLTELLDLPSQSSLHQRRQIINRLIDILQRLAEKTTVLVIIEDLHWIDPTTQEVVTRFLQRGLAARVLLLLSARPEFKSPWPAAQLPRLNIDPLADADIARIVKAVTPSLASPQVHRIIQRADGIPLFAEELCRLPNDATGNETNIPPTLQDLLTLQLDKLGPDKSFAQLAATIGREFSSQLLAELSFHAIDDLVTALFRLRQHGMIDITTADNWQFRHALIRDAAYFSQTRSDRQSAHLRIARIYESDRPDIVANHPELLAYHWKHAGQILTAVNCLIRAGRLSQSRSAHQEALTHFQTGFELLQQMETKSDPQLEWQLQIGIGAAAYAIEGYASTTGAAAYHRAVALGEKNHLGKKSFPALWGLWAGASSHTNWAHSLLLAQRLIRLAKNGKDPVARQQGYFAMGNVAFWRGEFENSCCYLKQAVAEYRSDQHEELIADYGENCFTTSNSYLSWTLCLLGFPQQAMVIGEQALEEARRTNHPFSLGYALTFHTVLHRMLRQPQHTLHYAELTIDLAREHNLPLWEVGASLTKGWAQVTRGNLKGLDLMQWSVDQVTSLMSAIAVIFFETQADGLYRAGRFKNALTVIERGLEQVEGLDDHHAEAELYRLKGCCLLELFPDNTDRAEECFAQAIHISRRQKALLFELRAATALADLRDRQAGRHQNCRLLIDVYHRFSEGFSFPDLITAQRQISSTTASS